MTKFEKSAEDKARKEHESEANVASTIATGEKGDLRDAVANEPPLVGVVRAVKDILEEALVRAEPEVVEEIVEAPEEVVEVTPELLIQEEDEGLEEIEPEPEGPTRAEEIADLMARILALETEKEEEAE